jgi:hypothetical protein
MQPLRFSRLSIFLLLLLTAPAAGLRAATSKLDLTTGAVQDPCVFAAYRVNIRIDNHDSSAVNANTLTVRFYFNTSATLSVAAGFYLYIYDSSGTYQGFAAITGTQTVMGSTCTLGGRSANRYIDFSFASFSIPAGGYASPNGGYVDIAQSGSGAFDAACDDYSGTNSTGFNEINRMTLYQSGSLVCEYTSSSTQDPNTGVEPCTGVGGCGAANTPTATPSVTPSATQTQTPAVTPTGTPSNSPFYSPTFTASLTGTPTQTPVLSPTVTPSITWTRTATPTQTTVTTPQTPSFTPTPLMTLNKSVNKTQAMLGETLTFYLDWTNDSSNATTYKIWDSVSPYLTYVGCNSGCTSSGSVVNWSFAAASGSSGQVAFWAYISSTP